MTDRSLRQALITVFSPYVYSGEILIISVIVESSLTYHIQSIHKQVLFKIFFQNALQEVRLS